MLFILLFPVIVLAQTLEVPALRDWERKDNIFGALTILSQKSDSRNMILFQKVEKKIASENFESELNRIIEQRKTSGSKPWSNIQTVYKEKQVLVVSYTQNQSKLLSVIKLYPLEKDYVLGFGKFASLELEEIKTSILPVFHAVKVNP